jgi:hypothetical protein
MRMVGGAHPTLLLPHWVPHSARSGWRVIQDPILGQMWTSAAHGISDNHFLVLTVGQMWIRRGRRVTTCHSRAYKNNRRAG